MKPVHAKRGAGLWRSAVRKLNPISPAEAATNITTRGSATSWSNAPNLRHDAIHATVGKITSHARTRSAGRNDRSRCSAPSVAPKAPASSDQSSVSVPLP